MTNLASRLRRLARAKRGATAMRTGACSCMPRVQNYSSSNGPILWFVNHRTGHGAPQITSQDRHQGSLGASDGRQDRRRCDTRDTPERAYAPAMAWPWRHAAITAAAGFLPHPHPSSRTTMSGTSRCKADRKHIYTLHCRCRGSTPGPPPSSAVPTHRPHTSVLGLLSLHTRLRGQERRLLWPARARGLSLARDQNRSIG